MASYGVVCSDENGVITSANANACKLFGYPQSFLIGKNTSILMPSPFAEQHDSYIKRYLNTKEAHVVGKSRIVTGKHADGTLMKLLLTLSDVETHKGRMFIAVFEKHQETKAVVTANEKMEILTASGPTYHMFGFTPEDLVGKKVDVLMPPEYQRQHEGFVNNYLGGGKPKAIGRVRNVQARHRFKKDPFPIALQLEEIPGADGKRLFRAAMTPVTKAEVTVTLDLNGTIVSASDDFLLLFGYESNEMLGKTIDVLVKCDLKALTEAAQRLKNQPERLRRHIAFTRDVVALHRDGSVFSAKIELQSFFPSETDIKEQGKSHPSSLSKPHNDLQLRVRIIRAGNKKEDKEIINEGEYMGHYIYGKTLGAGFFGKVRMAVHRLTGEKVAIKTLRRKQYEQVKMEFPPREIALLSALSHPYVNLLYDTVILHDRIHMILEFVDGKELCDIVQDNPLDEESARKYFRQIVIAVQYMHKAGVVHRDLKLENIIIDAADHAKIIDLGLGNFFGPETLLKTFCGSPDYAAPELFQGKPYKGPFADIWSLGVCLFAMLSGLLPFRSTADLIKGHLTYPAMITPEARDLINMILKVVPEERPSIEQIMDHAWLKVGYKGSPIPVPPMRREHVREDVLKILDGFGMEKERVLDAVFREEHNQISTTYYLTLQKIKREKRVTIINDGYDLDAAEMVSDASILEAVKLQSLPTPAHNTPVHTPHFERTDKEKETPSHVKEAKEKEKDDKKKSKLPQDCSIS